jgi:CBS domain-containing protein
MTVGDVCTRAVVTATADETLATAARRMRDHHVGTVVVVDGDGRNRPTGILTDRDIVVSAVAQSPDKIATLAVGDVMTRDPITVRPSASLQSALSTMHAKGVRRLPVVRADGVLEGLIAFDDLLEATSEDLNQLVGLVLREQSIEREVRR